MTDRIQELINETAISRRSFIKWSAALAAAASTVGGITLEQSTRPHKALAEGEEQIVRSCCPAHNCGGRCLLVLTVKDGVITRIGTDDRTYDEPDDPRLVACARGRSYRRRQYHPDRLKYPMKRVGKRGEGKFERISWEEAVDLAATQIKRVKEKYGNSALYVPYGTGGYSNMNGANLASRLFNMYGGCLSAYNNYSWAAIQKATPYVYGTQLTGNQRQDWLNSRYIIMWSWNPGEMIDGTNSAYFVKKAHEKGAKVICIDPRKSMSAVGLADEWIPIRPGTDTAMMSAMAYVMITEKLYDAEFVKTHCVGFDKTQMPEGMENEESYSDYILGTKDKTPKTPEWAEAITGVPREKIVQIAREYATIKPAMLYQGYGMQRRAYGEQNVIGGCVLAAITGNVGIPGGWASGIAFQVPDWGPFWTVIGNGDNAVKTSIPTFKWTDAVVRGKEMTAADGVVGADKLDNNIKLIYAVASNALINQHADINKNAEILRDESLVEFLIVQDQFLSTTGRFADLLLPACTQFENWGAQDGWKYGEEVLFQPKVVEPYFESKSDYAICAMIAEKLGVGQAYSEGKKDEREWMIELMEVYKKRFPECPSFKEFVSSNKGVYSRPVKTPAVAFVDFRNDPEANKLDTPSGKIELFSKTLFDMNKPDEIPAVPKYIQEWESPFGPEAEKYPLQALGHHYLHRVHSTHDNNDWLDEAHPQRVFINPVDARARGIGDGDKVRIYNDRGTIVMPCRLTNRMMPGVIDIPQGGWWTPDANGVDQRGAVNVLSSHRATPLAFGNAQHTIMVQVEKA